MNFAALELVTFNQVKMIWAEKKKETLTEVSYLLGYLVVDSSGPSGPQGRTSGRQLSLL